ncbi:MAG TPA: hypothetical protein QGF58_06650 [Myxococcota bacterium]|nr:hypothetical protein [Myxococcota bacterium]
MLPLMLACVLNDLSQPSTVDRTRILAVRATPAEAQPGDTVRLRALAVDPDVGIQSLIWFGCLLEDSSDFGCDEPQLIGVVAPGGGIPTFDVPADLLDGLSEEERLEGMNYLVQIQAVPNGVDLEAIAAGEVEGAELATLGESGYKRVPVSLAPTPNDNPAIEHVLGEAGIVLEKNDTLVLSPGQTYELEAVLADDAVQAYTFRNSDGEDEERVEEPYISLYATVGTFDQFWKLHPHLNFEYTAPEDPASETGTLWIVVRDRRGGMGWLELNLSFR